MVSVGVQKSECTKIAKYLVDIEKSVCVRLNVPLDTLFIGHFRDDRPGNHLQITQDAHSVQSFTSMAYIYTVTH